MAKSESCNAGGAEQPTTFDQIKRLEAERNAYKLLSEGQADLLAAYRVGRQAHATRALAKITHAKTALQALANMQ